MMSMPSRQFSSFTEQQSSKGHCTVLNGQKIDHVTKGLEATKMQIQGISKLNGRLARRRTIPAVFISQESEE